MLIARASRFLSALVVACLALVLPATASAAGESVTFTSPIDGLVVGGNTVMVMATATATPSPVSVLNAPAKFVVNGGAAATGCDAGGVLMEPDPFDPAVNPVMLSCTWDASALSDGANTLTALVSDGTPTLVPTTPINLTIDNTPPSGGSITVPSQDSTATTVNVGYVAGTADAHLGAVFMQRASAPIVGGVCGTFSGFSTDVFVNLRPIASPFVDNTLVAGNCYRYRLQELDTANNETFYTSPNTVIVRSAASPIPPTLALALTGTGTGIKVDGSTVYYNPATPTGNSFTVTGTTGAGSGVITNVMFPDVDGAGTGWTPAGFTDTTAPYSTSYTYTAAATSSGTQTVTVNDANGTSATASFTLTADSAAPTGGSVSAALGTATGSAPPIVVTMSAGTDPSGIATRVLKRTTGERVAGDCVKFGALETVATNPGSTFTDTNTAEDRCYVYQLVATDSVGNSATFDDPTIVVVNTKRAVVTTTSGKDRFEGTDDAEYVALGAGNDVARLGGGNDSANGGTGNDTIRGNLGDDCTIYGGGGDDLIFGGPGKDCLSGSFGNDKVHGGSGDDQVGGGHGDDTVTGGLGDDNLDGGHGVDKVGGGEGNDTIDGSYDNDVVLGHDGNDTIDGSYGDDKVSGGPGNDNLDGLFGSDLVDGGTGDDTIRGDNDDDKVIGGAGTDTIDAGRGNDTVDGGSGDDTIKAGSDDDKAGGGVGNDTIDGGFGNDKLDGESGNDALTGQSGNDDMSGGDGDDTLTDRGGFDALEGGPGNDKLSDYVMESTGSAPARYGMYGGPGNDNMSLSWSVDFTALVKKPLTLRSKPYAIDCGGGTDVVSLWMNGSAAMNERYFDENRDYTKQPLAKYAGIALTSCASARLLLSQTETTEDWCDLWDTWILGGGRGRDRAWEQLGVSGAGAMKVEASGPKCKKAFGS
jgi:Ca2+-binding RTX toxin-like protein